MTFSSRPSEAEMPQPFENKLKNWRYHLKRCRYSGASVTTIPVDDLEDLVDAYEAVHGKEGE